MSKATGAGNGAAGPVVAHRVDGTGNAQAQVIRAELSGDDTCAAAGITVTAYASVLAMCRALLAAGIDPDTAMECWRGATLAMRVRSIGEAAGLEIAADGVGFRRLRKPDAAPLVRLNSGVAR
jgi:hypothetical protein